MVPVPQEQVSMPKGPVAAGPGADGERIVISGLSGIYPQCHNVKELSDVLYNKVNPVTMGNPRWNFEHPDVPPYTGKIPDLNRFDASFFMVNKHMTLCMDMLGRKVLEQTYVAIFDAGIGIESLNGKNVGVFIGAGTSEFQKNGCYDVNEINGFVIQGASKTMYSNRISYWLNLKGPSMTIDDSCCSSVTALTQACQAIRRGDCDSAIVGGTFLCLHPQSTLHFGRTMKLSMDGKTKSFAENADGCTISDCTSMIYLQKAKDAKRIYAEVVHSKAEFVSLPKGDVSPKYGFQRIPATVTKFLRRFYDEVGVSPEAVEYVEAFGCGEPEAEKAELDVIDEVFCKNRKEPLFVGSVMSNIGYTEGASGMSSIAKVVLGYETGKFAANLHCESPRRDVAALRDGRMRVVTEHQRTRRSYVAINGSSITGLNSHILLHGHNKLKDPSRYKSNIPHLVTISGRQESAVEKVIKDLKSRPIDPEEIALLHSIHETTSSGLVGRGFVILDTNAEGETVSVGERMAHCDDAKRELWFVYSGMGSQWVGMGTHLMRIPVFAAAIERCQKVLEPRGVDIVDIITSTDKTMFDNILHSFVGIAAVQIGLTDVLREMGLTPDKIIGHSVGELGCAYADGCFTAEEMILAAYCRGLVSVETPFIRGSMAAVGIGYQKISKMCPPEIAVACHNGPESSTISGPADAMREFVGRLTAQGIFAREVPCSNIAYHSRYIAEAGPKLLERLEEVIKSPRERSDRWVSTSVPQERWHEPNTKLSSAWYHTNNLLNPVLFEETSRLVPAGAVLVEVAPHGLLQAILKRSLPADCRHVPLTRRGHEDNALHLLEAIGSLYMEGYNPMLQALYPQVEFPVSTATPMLSHLVEFSHNDKWKVPLYVDASKKVAAVYKLNLSVHDDEHSYLQGNVIRDARVFPFAAALVAVWDTLAMASGAARAQLSVQFRDVLLRAQPPLHDQRQLRLRVALHRGTGHFEVTDEFSLVARGHISATLESSRGIPKAEVREEDLVLGPQDIYQLLEDKDYFYKDEFRSIHRSNVTFTEAQLLWRDNWVTLLDGMLQLNVLRRQHASVSLPSHINKITIDVAEHGSSSKLRVGDHAVMPVNLSETQGYTRCGGVLLEDIIFYDVPVPTENSFELKTLISDSRDNIIEPSTKDMTAEHGTDVALQSARPGDLDSLHWVEVADPVGPEPLVTVHYAALNDLDVKRATGVALFNNEGGSSDTYYGMDFSGVTESGQRVMGLARGGAARGRVRAALQWPVPAHWTLEDAATVPSAYAQALYCLGIRCQLAEGMAVLVHGGAGALGQAALCVAIAHGCSVFTTVATANKKRFLRRLFPSIPEHHIGNSRDNTFADMVLRGTRGRGCDIIISCVPGNLKDVTLQCASYCGVTMDTHQVHSKENYSYGMFYMTKQRSYALVDFTTIFDHPEDIKKLRAMLSEGIACGYVRPLSRVTYEAAAAARALRLLAASRHRGRVLLRLRPAAPPAHPRIICSPDGCHVVFCDKDGLGARWADELVRRGARNLCLHSPQPSVTLTLKALSWQKNGVKVVLSSQKVCDASDVLRLVNECRGTGPVEGVYVFVPRGQDETSEEITSLINHLDATTRKYCPSIKYFAAVGALDKVGPQVFLARAKDQLPSTFLHLPSSLNKRAAAAAVAAALRGARTLLAAHAQPPRPRTLQSRIAAIAEIEIPENTKDSATLKSLGLDDSKSSEICSFLFNTYNVSLSEEEIPRLSLLKIREIEEYTTEPKREAVKGLGAFFPRVEFDEILDTMDMMFLPTLTHPATVYDHEFDVKEPHLYIVPGLDGQHARFLPLCERLKLGALLLQPGLDRAHEQPQHTAARYAQALLKKAKAENGFYLLGYEFGVSLALEVAAILESHGLEGTIFCIGAAPEEFRASLEEQVGAEGAALQHAVARHVCGLLVDGPAAGSWREQLDAALQRAGSWQETLDACVRLLAGRVRHSLQYARMLLHATLVRVQAARAHRAPRRQLRSRIVHIAATVDGTASAGSLQPHSTRPVARHELRAPLAHACEDPRCAALLNRHLRADTLCRYDAMNRCETYLLDANNMIKKVDML